MRDEVLDKIETYRSYDKFDSRTMRWSGWLLSPTDGIVVTYSRKERKRMNHLPHLEDTTRADFDKLDDQTLLDALQAIIIKASRQM